VAEKRQVGVVQGTYAQQTDAQQAAAANAAAAAHAAAFTPATADNAQQQQQHPQQHGGPGEVTMTPGGGQPPIISISDAPVYHDAHGDAVAAAAAQEHEQQVSLFGGQQSGPHAACASLRSLTAACICSLLWHNNGLAPPIQ